LIAIYYAFLFSFIFAVHAFFLQINYASAFYKYFEIFFHENVISFVRKNTNFF